MISSAATSSPVSASTLAYLMRWPVLRLIWLKLTFSVSDVAGYRATGQVTSERRKKPFQLARGAMGILRNATDDPVTISPGNPDLNGWSRESPNGVNRGRAGSLPPGGGVIARPRGPTRRPKPGTSSDIGRCFRYLAPQGVNRTGNRGYHGNQTTRSHRRNPDG